MKRIALLFLFTLLFAPHATAQQSPVVKSFSLTMDHIPGNQRRNDLNNVPCALIKVQATDDIERVEGSVIGDIVKKGVEKWVFLCKGSPKMKIHFKNNLPLQVTFSNYGTDRVESNRVYELVVELPNQTATASPSVTQPVQPTPVTPPVTATKYNYLQLKVIPDNATITIWGDNLQKKEHRPQADGRLRTYLPYGRYNYQVKADGYEAKTGSLFIDDNDTWHTIQLTVDRQQQVQKKAREDSLKAAKKAREKKLKAANKAHEDSLKAANKAREGNLKAANKARKDSLKAANKEREDSLARSSKLAQAQRQADAQKGRQRLREEKAKQKAESQRQKIESKKLRADQKRQQTEQNKQQAELKRKEKSEHKAIRTTTSTETFGFELQAGLNIASAAFETRTGDHYSSITSFHFGPKIDYRLHETFALQGALLLSGKGFNNDNHFDDFDAHATAYYLDIPVEAAYIPFSTDAFQLRIFTGPYTAIGLSGSIKDQRYHDFDDPFFNIYRSVDFGLSFGASVLIGGHVSLRGSYQLGLNSGYPNRCLGFGLGYRF